MPVDRSLKGALVLVADDDPGVLRLVAKVLTADGFTVVEVTDGEEALLEARELRPDAVLLDVMMPRVDGIEVCRRLRQDSLTKRMSIILLTARATAADKLEGLRAGADDYITKPFDPRELVERVKTAIRRNREMAALNPLTGLPGNRQVEELLERLVLERAPFALMHIDLDNFKAFNDRYGVLRGDMAIKRLVAIVEGALAVPGAGRGFVGHIGGDDVVAVVDPNAAEAMAETIVEAWDEAAPDLYDERDAQNGYIEVHDRRRESQRVPLMTVSIGIASTEGREISTHLHAADIAAEMKQLAKRRPRSNFALDRRREVAPAVPPKAPAAEDERDLEPGHLLRSRRLRRAMPPQRLWDQLQVLAEVTKARREQAEAGSEEPRQTVLIVDDDDDVRDVLRLHCELNGFPVVAEAGDGIDAVRLAIEHQPSFVILDYRMPEMDGEEAAGRIRDVVPGVQLIAFSGVLTERPSWADDFLSKEQITEITPLLGRLLDTRIP